MLHITTRRRDATPNALQLRPGRRQYNNSEQQNKRCKANNTATATSSPLARPAASTEPPDQRTNEAVHWHNAHILIRVLDVPIAVCAPVGVVEVGQLPWDQRVGAVCSGG